MTAKPGSCNLEHATLVSLTDSLITAIDMVRSEVAQKLVEESLISHKSLKSKAVDLFEQVLKAVEINPESYKKFLGVIDQCPCIKSQVDVIRKAYKEKKQQSEAQEKVCKQISIILCAKNVPGELHS